MRVLYWKKYVVLLDVICFELGNSVEIFGKNFGFYILLWILFLVSEEEVIKVVVDNGVIIYFVFFLYKG